MFSANITTDFRYNSNGTSKDVLVYLKKAYLQAKLSPAFIVRAGEADLPWVPFAEGLYGYRFVENTYSSTGRSSELRPTGACTCSARSDPSTLVSYQVSAINGAGYKNLSRSTNTIDLEGRVSVNPVKEITVAAGGYTGKLGKSNDTVNVHIAQSASMLLAAYTDKQNPRGGRIFLGQELEQYHHGSAASPPPNTPNDKAMAGRRSARSPSLRSSLSSAATIG